MGEQGTPRLSISASHSAAGRFVNSASRISANSALIAGAIELSLKALIGIEFGLADSLRHLLP